MTRSGVGRSQRAASRPAYPPPTGGQPRGLLTTQGAATRSTVGAEERACEPRRPDNIGTVGAEERACEPRRPDPSGARGAGKRIGVGAPHATPVAHPARARATGTPDRPASNGAGAHGRPGAPHRRWSAGPTGDGAAYPMVTAVAVNGDRAVPAITGRDRIRFRGSTPAAVTDIAAQFSGAAAAAPSGTEVPTRPAPAQPRGWVVSGQPTSASVAPPGGGAFAAVPTAAVAVPAANRRPAVLVDTGGAGRDARTPTVSPD